jgi:hypothetical protein
MCGVAVTVGGAPSSTTPCRVTLFFLVVTWTLGVILPLVGSAQSGSSETTQATQSTSQTKPATAGELKELRQKAEQGDATALCQLGTIYEDEQVVPKDYTEAFKSFTLDHVLSGDLQNDCSHKLDRLQKQMPAEQLAEALKRAEEWRAAAHFTKAPDRY